MFPRLQSEKLRTLSLLTISCLNEEIHIALNRMLLLSQNRIHFCNLVFIAENLEAYRVDA
jgi:hypothetical protein